MRAPAMGQHQSLTEIHQRVPWGVVRAVVETSITGDLVSFTV